MLNNILYTFLIKIPSAIEEKLLKFAEDLIQNGLGQIETNPLLFWCCIGLAACIWIFLSLKTFFKDRRKRKEHNKPTNLTSEDLSPQEQPDCTVSHDITRFTSIKCSCVWKAPNNETIDIDLSCVAFNEMGRIIDHVYSPKISKKLLTHYGMPLGKLISKDNAIRHSGDNISTDPKTFTSEIITFNLADISSDINRLIIFVNSPQNSFHKLTCFAAKIIGVTSDGQEHELGLHKSPKKSKKTNTALIFPYIEKNQSSWSLLRDFSTSNYGNIGETISSLIDKNKIVDCPDTLNNREKTYRINDVHFTVGEDDGKVGLISKAILYGLVVSAITAFLRFRFDLFVETRDGITAKLVYTTFAYLLLSIWIADIIQRKASFKFMITPFISGLLILVSIILSHLISIFYIESSHSISVSYVEYLGFLTWWQWAIHIGTIILVPLSIFNDFTLETKSNHKHSLKYILRRYTTTSTNIMFVWQLQLLLLIIGIGLYLLKFPLT